MTPGIYRKHNAVSSREDTTRSISGYKASCKENRVDRRAAICVSPPGLEEVWDITASTPVRLEQHTYDPDGRLVTLTGYPDEAANIRTTQLDYLLRNLVKSLVRVEETGERGRVTTYDYDLQYRLEHVELPHDDGISLDSVDYVLLMSEKLPERSCKIFSRELGSPVTELIRKMTLISCSSTSIRLTRVRRISRWVCQSAFSSP